MTNDKLLPFQFPAVRGPSPHLTVARLAGQMVGGSPSLQSR